MLQLWESTRRWCLFLWIIQTKVLLILAQNVFLWISPPVLLLLFFFSCIGLIAIFLINRTKNKHFVEAFAPRSERNTTHRVIKLIIQQLSSQQDRQRDHAALLLYVGILRFQSWQTKQSMVTLQHIFPELLTPHMSESSLRSFTESKSWWAHKLYTIQGHPIQIFAFKCIL